MNSFMKAQIFNTINFVKTFEVSCKMAAQKDDGRIDPHEAKTLNQLNNATQHFVKELERIQRCC